MASSMASMALSRTSASRVAARSARSSIYFEEARERYASRFSFQPSRRAWTMIALWAVMPWSRHIWRRDIRPQTNSRSRLW
jgi:hypothetical protein